MIETIIIVTLSILICYVFSVGCAIGILRHSKIWLNLVKATEADAKSSNYKTLQGVSIVFAPVFLVLFLLLCIGALGYNFTKLIIAS